MYLDKNAILDSLSKEDIKTIVTTLGSGDPKIDNNGNLIFQTICHNPPDPSNSYKLYYYHEPSDKYKGKVFHCYSGCQESFSVIELVIRANRAKGSTVTWYKALYWIASITGKLDITSSPLKESQSEKVDFHWLNKLKSIKNKKRNVPVLPEISENILEIFYYAPHETWLKEHISKEALSRYEIGYYGLTDQITIPHRDKNGRLIGIRGRFLNKEDEKNVGKYVPLQVEGHFLSHRLGCNLYGLHVVKDRVTQLKKIMLVEGEKSCLQAYSYFGDDSFVVAVCGSEISTTQIKIINELNVEEVIVGFDRDYHDAHSYEAGLWWQRLLKKVAPLVSYTKVTICVDTKDRLEYKDSPFDKGKEILLELLEEKIPVTMKDILESRIKNYEE